MNSLITSIHEKGVALVAVSKGQSVEAMLTLYHLGVRDFAENRVHEALEKMALLPTDIRWHFIGRLQSNKLKKIVGHFYCVQSVHDATILEKIEAMGQPQKVLLQVNSQSGPEKAGFTPEQWLACAKQLMSLKHVQIEGLMTMAPHTPHEEAIRSCFRGVVELQKQLREKTQGRWAFNTLSMGMSEDYQLAIEEGATSVRLGRALFSCKTKRC